MNAMSPAPTMPNTTPSAIPSVRSLVCFGLEGPSLGAATGASVVAGLLFDKDVDDSVASG